MPRERINITDPLHDVCSRLGLEPKNVRELTITPGAAVATVYLLRDGKKYVEGDEPATETRTFKVRT